MKSRTGHLTSDSITLFGVISDLDTKNFKLEKGESFYVKNEGEEVTLEVIPVAAKGDSAYVPYKFEPGWNEVLIRKIKINATENTLLWGY